MLRVKAPLPQEEDHKSRSLCRESDVEGQNHALCQPTIAPGGLEKRGQLCSSIAEQPKARSVHLQVMPRSSNAGAKLPILPRMFPPAATGAQKQKGSFEGKDFLASSCPQREAAEPVGARNPDHTKVTHLFPCGRAAHGSANLPNSSSVKTPSYVGLPHAVNRLNFPSRAT